MGGIHSRNVDTQIKRGENKYINNKSDLILLQIHKLENYLKNKINYLENKIPNSEVNAAVYINDKEETKVINKLQKVKKFCSTHKLYIGNI